MQYNGFICLIFQYVFGVFGCDFRVCCCGMLGVICCCGNVRVYCCCGMLGFICCCDVRVPVKTELNKFVFSLYILMVICLIFVMLVFNLLVI